jgi:hypothetical protein
MPSAGYHSTRKNLDYRKENIGTPESLQAFSQLFLPYFEDLFDYLLTSKSYIRPMSTHRNVYTGIAL